MKSGYNNNNFKITAPAWNDKFDLPDESYSISDFQDYLKYIIKKHETIADNPLYKFTSIKSKTGLFLK